MAKKEEIKVKVNTEEPKEKGKKAEEMPKPTIEEVQQQVIFLTKQAADAQKKAREAEDKAKSEIGRAHV